VHFPSPNVARLLFQPSPTARPPLDDPYQKEHAVAAALEMQNDHRRCRYVRVQSFG
jgi:hypothetical protein